MTAQKYRDQAARYRALADHYYGSETRTLLLRMASEDDERAAKLECDNGSGAKPPS